MVESSRAWSCSVVYSAVLYSYYLKKGTKMKYHPLFLCDYYKVSHHRLYPKGTEFIYSNFTARGSRLENINSIVVFGIQYLIRRYLLEEFYDNFFDLNKDHVLTEYKRRMDTSLGKDSVDISHIAALHDLGYLPLCIKSLPEGTVCPVKTPFLTIVNTEPQFFWLTNYIETLLSTTLWHPITAATIAHAYRKILDKYAALTSDTPNFVDWQGHDFSARGLGGTDMAAASGAAHLLSFTGTDTVHAIDFLEHYYLANSNKELIGGSVPASEHSCMSAGGKDDEFATYRRILTKSYPTGPVSIVSDTWDFWHVLTDILPKLKTDIMKRDGKMIIRPDSGDPSNIICGDPAISKGTWQGMGAMRILWDLFGGTINSKGFKVLDSHVGLIYGDSITLKICEDINERLMQMGFASTNMVYGIGSFSYQYVTRDSLGFAMKATNAVINGVSMPLFKDPITDTGCKKSARGLLRVNADLSLSENVTPEEEKKGVLETVFHNGVLIKQQSLRDIRQRLAASRIGTLV